MPHKVFERRGDDLYTNVTITLQVRMRDHHKFVAFINSAAL